MPNSSVTPEEPAVPGAPVAGASAQPTELARRVISLLPEHGRILVGIAGCPGAGKTTLARQVVAQINDLLGSDNSAVHLPLDGFHLANSTLNALGWQGQKGAIDTFDGWGFVALLRRLLTEVDHAIYAPSFDRRMNDPIAAEITVLPSVRVVVVEGNYLLNESPPWNQVNSLLHESWFCATGEAERYRRLVERHERHGRSAEAAREWAESVDGPNARLIESTRHRAGMVVLGQ